MSATQDEINELVEDRAGELGVEFASRMPGDRFVNDDGAPGKGQIKLTPDELVDLLKVAIEVGMEIEREGTT